MNLVGVEEVGRGSQMSSFGTTVGPAITDHAVGVSPQGFHGLQVGKS